MFKRILMAAALAILGGTVEAATVYRLNATSLSQSLSNFTILFTDGDSDGQLDFGEVDTFSGLTFYDRYSFEGVTYDAFLDVLETVPEVFGISDFGTSFANPLSIYDWRWTTSYLTTVTDSLGNTFSFHLPAISTGSNFTYQITAVPLPPLPGCGPSGGRPPKCNPDISAVPLPAALPLLLAGLGGLGFIGRRKKKAAWPNCTWV